MTDQPVAMVIHGGAGPLRGGDYGREMAHMRGLIETGRERLNAGAAALDVVQETIVALEASGLYVAGRGASPNSDGVYELDASLMHGPTRRLGAVAALVGFKSPITTARAVMDETPHVLLAGQGAAAFARRGRRWRRSTTPPPGSPTPGAGRARPPRSWPPAPSAAWPSTGPAPWPPAPPPAGRSASSPAGSATVRSPGRVCGLTTVWPSPAPAPARCSSAPPSQPRSPTVSVSRARILPEPPRPLSPMSPPWVAKAASSPSPPSASSSCPITRRA